MKRSFGVAALLASLVVLVSVVPAHATPRGKNGRIAYAQDRGTGSEIYTMKADGSDRRRLTDQDRSAWFPDWSPDGTKIVFELDVPGESCGSVELMNADGTGLVDLTSVSPRLQGACAQGPSFTPNGRRVVFAAGSFTIVEGIWSFDLQGEHLRRIIATRRLAGFAPRDRTLKSPHVSPDGRTLLFETVHYFHHDLNEKGLFTVKMDGRHLREVVPFSYDVGLKGGEWAPNGNRIAFSDHAGPLPSDDPQNILTVRPDGTGIRQLTDYRGLPTDLGTGLASYSPDGRWILFKHSDFNKDKNTLWKVQPDGTHLTRIVRAKFYFLGAVVWGRRPRS